MQTNIRVSGKNATALQAYFCLGLNFKQALMGIVVKVKESRALLTSYVKPATSRKFRMIATSKQGLQEPTIF